MAEAVAQRPKYGFEQSSPECRMAALGLLVRELDRNKSSSSGSRITASDGTVITYGEACDFFKSMIGSLTDR